MGVTCCRAAAAEAMPETTTITTCSHAGTGKASNCAELSTRWRMVQKATGSCLILALTFTTITSRMSAPSGIRTQIARLLGPPPLTNWAKGT